MVFKSFSSTYSFISDGNKTKEETHEILNNNNKNIKKMGTQNYKNRKDNTLKQNFYKTHNNKSLYGTTGLINNKTKKVFKIQEQINTIKNREYITNKNYDSLFSNNKMIKNRKKVIEDKVKKNKNIIKSNNPFQILLNIFDEPFFNQ
tara:strand:+ start:62 stop:502 length:441 start_codon:yes stop_codon:yes gene_type:complete